MTGDLTFIHGFAEGREWAVNWAGEEILQRIASGGSSLEADTTGEWARRNGRNTYRVLEALTALLFNRPLPPRELWAFWQQALPDIDSASLRDLRFLSGFLAGARYIAREPL